MTENELRRNVVSIINSWLGATMGSNKHREILNIYNAYKPLARGYKVQVGDSYCATTVSAAWIKAGIAEYTGTECSCNELIRIAASKGIWQERDDYAPKIGDAVLYDWQDSGKGDNVGQADHIGIVVSVTGDGFTVTEGNTSGGKVAQRNMRVDGVKIRGFICPDYKAIAEIMSRKEEDNMTGEQILKKINEYLSAQKVPDWAEGELAEAVRLGITDGSNPTGLIPRYQAAIMAKRAALAAAREMTER